MGTGDQARDATHTAILERILEVTRQLAAPFDLNQLLAQVVEAARDLLGADRGSVFLYDRGTHELVSAVATGVGELRFPADRGIIGEAARTRTIVNVPDCATDPRFNPEGDRRTGYTTRCILAVPLVGFDSSLVGVLQLLNKTNGPFSAEDERTAEALAAQCAVALQRVQMTEQLVLKERLDRELALARQIQIALLPQEMPKLPGYDIGALSRPAEETGGDTFDLVETTGDVLVLLLGDATGHGIGPALSVTQARSMLRMAVRLGADLDDAFRHINDQLSQDLPPNRAVTAFLGLLDARTHDVRFHAGGQGPILHFHAAENRCEWLGATTLPMGFFEMHSRPQSQRLHLDPGDILALITDGVFEAEDEAGVPFGDRRVGELIRRHQAKPMSELVQFLLTDVDAHFAPARQADDVTLLLVRRLP